MRTVCTVGLTILASTSALLAQAPATKVEFEVASVRPVQLMVQERVNVGLRMDGSQVHVGALTLREYLAMSYRLRPYQVSGPDWIASDRFSLDAKLPAGAAVGQIPQMLQALLTDRFGLKMHREQKEMSIYALVVGKPPLKLKDSPPLPAEESGKQEPPVNVAVTGA